MKEMIYTTKEKIEILDTGYCLGLLYYILSLGPYPCAYVRIPQDHEFYKKDHGSIYIDVHGGLSYSKDYLLVSDNEKVDGWFIGWDYAHYGDYLGYDMLPILQQFKENHKYDKKWSTEEIFKDVKAVCYQIRYEESKDKLMKKKITHNQARELLGLQKIENKGEKNE